MLTIRTHVQLAKKVKNRTVLILQLGKSESNYSWDLSFSDWVGELNAWTILCCLHLRAWIKKKVWLSVAMLLQLGGNCQVTPSTYSNKRTRTQHLRLPQATQALASPAKGGLSVVFLVNGNNSLSVNKTWDKICFLPNKKAIYVTLENA